MKTVIRFDPQNKSELEKICRDIAKKDESFLYKFLDKELLLYGKDKSKCHKLGMWFVHKTDLVTSYKVENDKKS